jgi:GNAT superfamily N-acetyltransferase
MTPAEPLIRPATTDDIQALEVVLVANETPTPDEPPFPLGVQEPYLRHLVEDGTVAVAEVEGVVVGFGAAVFTGRTTHLADLFVLPAYHGRGLGGQLLRTVLGERWPRTTFSSDDPRAMPLYIRAGMAPLWPNLFLAGDPRELTVTDGATRTEEIAFDELVRIERGWYELDRSRAVPYWATLPSAQAFVVTGGRGKTVAATLIRRRLNGVGRWVDRAVVAPSVEPLDPLLAVMRIPGEPQELIGASVPGPSPVLPVLLGAGFRIKDRDTYMASDPTVVDPTRHLTNTGIL